MYWYHSHAMNTSEHQVMNGMSGAIIIEGLLDPFPELEGITEYLFVLRDLQLVLDPQTGTWEIPARIHGNNNTTRTINGMVSSSISIRPAEIQLWRIANTSPNIFYKLVLQNDLTGENRTFHQIAQDGYRQNQMVNVTEMLIPPGSRLEVLVVGPTSPDNYVLRTLAIDTGPEGNQWPTVDLAVMVVDGVPDHRHSLPKNNEFPPVQNLKNLPVTRNRTFVLQDDPTNSQKFYINQKPFDPERVDVTVNYGDVELWILRNAAGEDHPFHIHQLHFQVLEVNSVPTPFIGLQDTINVPRVSANDTFGEVQILVPFNRFDIFGKFVAHCHILNHEDGGMMITILVVDPKHNQVKTSLP